MQKDVARSDKCGLDVPPAMQLYNQHELHSMFTNQVVVTAAQLWDRMRHVSKDPNGRGSAAVLKRHVTGLNDRQAQELLVWITGADTLPPRDNDRRGAHLCPVVKDGYLPLSRRAPTSCG